MSKSTYNNLVSVPDSTSDTIGSGTSTIGGDLIDNDKALANYANGVAALGSCKTIRLVKNNYGCGAISGSISLTNEGQYTEGYTKLIVLRYNFCVFYEQKWECGILAITVDSGCGASPTVTSHTVLGGNIGSGSESGLSFTCNSSFTLSYTSSTTTYSNMAIQVDGIGY